MHVERAKILHVILNCAQRILEELPSEERKGFQGFHASSDLFGGDSPFDSLHLVAFIVDLEQQLEKQFGVQIALADERVMSQPVNPFKRVSTLADYVGMLLSER